MGNGAIFFVGAQLIRGGRSLFEPTEGTVQGVGRWLAGSSVG